MPALAQIEPALDRAEHERQAEEAEQASQWAAALSHLDWLLNAKPLDDPAVPTLLASLCTLAPHAAADPTRPVRLAEKTVANQPTNPAFLSTLGAALYRAGRLEAAVRRLRAAPEGDPQGGDAEPWLLMAMGTHSLGRRAEARQWFDRAVRWTDAATRRNRDE